jgi:hypothetical protein
MVVLLLQVLFNLAFERCTNHLVRLLAELRGHVVVLLLRLCVCDGRQFIVSRLMRGDLRRSCSSLHLVGGGTPGFADSVDGRRPDTLACTL